MEMVDIEEREDREAEEESGREGTVILVADS